MGSAPLIRPIEPADDAALARVIRTVMTEFGADGPGFSIHDPEVDRMFDAYAGERARFFVVEQAGEVVGGAGIAPLDGADDDTCELKKMYFLASARGRGVGRKLLDLCLESAREFGFARCYLESVDRMTAARALYSNFGFRPIDAPMGSTGHHGCDRWYVLGL